MPRKSLAKERTEQILDAFERCVVRYGLGGTSLEQVAQEAGVKRSILRHYVGNRDEIVLAMANRLVERTRSELREMADYIGDEVGDSDRIDRLLKALFMAPKPGRVSDGIVTEALIAAAETNLKLRRLMRSVIEEVVEAVNQQLRRIFPHADKQRTWSVAYGVVAISLCRESLLPLSLPKRYGAAALAASRRLIESLQE